MGILLSDQNIYVEARRHRRRGPLGKLFPSD